MHENPGPKKFGDFLGGYFVGKILRVALWRRRFLAAPAARNIPRRFLEGALTHDKPWKLLILEHSGQIK